MNFFTTRDLMEIAGVPFSTPHDKPTRREALAYYRGIAAKFEIPLALHEEAVALERQTDGFEVTTRRVAASAIERRLRAKTVTLAQGYFHRPRKLGVAGEELTWVSNRYREPYKHFDEHVLIVGGGNSALEAALDLWRNHVRVTVVHRGAAVKDTVKYWIKPDFENRVSEGSIEVCYESTVSAFVETPEAERRVELHRPSGLPVLAVDAVYVLVGYEPDTEIARGCGVAFDPETLVPVFDRQTCESDVPGLYLAGTVQVGRDIGKLFIENSRVHADRIVEHVASTRGRSARGRG